MAKRIPVAYYIGVQDGVGELWNLLLPNGVRNNKLGVVHPYDSTLIRSSIERLVPGVVFPKNPRPVDRWNGEDPHKAPEESIAYVYV